MLVGEETPQCVRHLGAPLFRHLGGRSDEVLVDGTGEQFEPPLEVGVGEGCAGMARLVGTKWVARVPAFAEKLPGPELGEGVDV